MRMKNPVGDEPEFIDVSLASVIHNYVTAMSGGGCADFKQEAYCRLSTVCSEIEDRLQPPDSKKAK